MEKLMANNFREILDEKLNVMPVEYKEQLKLSSLNEGSVSCRVVSSPVNIFCNFRWLLPWPLVSGFKWQHPCPCIIILNVSVIIFVTITIIIISSNVKFK
ncbi:hypothetical protein ACLKA7_013280 [Drosophila subpalustris]